MSNEPFFPEPPPEVDSAGIAVGGNIKAIYKVTGMRQKVEENGANLVEAHTECGRVICTRKIPGADAEPVYEVTVSFPESDNIDRSYCGPVGSDAHRVYEGYVLGWEKTKAKTEAA